METMKTIVLIMVVAVAAILLIRIAWYGIRIAWYGIVYVHGAFHASPCVIVIVRRSPFTVTLW